MKSDIRSLSTLSAIRRVFRVGRVLTIAALMVRAPWVAFGTGEALEGHHRGYPV